MNILGISYNGPNPGACLLQHGRLIAMAEEERFVRVKTASLYFPSNAADYCLKKGGISLSQVDRVVSAWEVSKYVKFMPEFYARLAREYGPKGKQTAFAEPGILNLFHPEHMALKIHAGLRHGRRMDPVPPLEYVEHHRAHAASAFYCSGFEDAGVLTIDGSGEEQATVLWKGSGLKLEPVEAIELPHSLGWVYSAVTEFLGFRPYSDEGSVMGLACYGRSVPEYEKAFEELIQITEEGYRINPRYLHYGEHTYGSKFTDELVDLLGRPRLRHEPLTRREEDIAWALQNRLEHAVIALLKRLVAKTGCRNLCLSGGVALNCKMNQRLRETGLIEGIFIQPVSMDAGTALGAAQLLSVALGEDPRFKMTHAYWGPEFTNEEIESALVKQKIEFRRCENIEKEVAERLARRELVGWFQGRSEIGPRALGARSILANPLFADSRDQVNEAVKYREPWRPFAPSILEEDLGEYVEDAVTHPFMIMTFRARKGMETQVPAVVHVDQTLRPQTVNLKDHPRYRKLIEEFKALTGRGMILNTSFNVKGEPVVNTPFDAVRTFYGSGLDALAIGDYLVVKRGKS